MHQAFMQRKQPKANALKYRFNALEGNNEFYNSFNVKPIKPISFKFFQQFLLLFQV